MRVARPAKATRTRPIVRQLNAQWYIFLNVGNLAHGSLLTVGRFALMACASRWGQSRRDCAPQPRDARNELPWEIVCAGLQPQRGCSRVGNPRPQPRWGWLDPMRWTQGSSFLATLGFESESLWDSRNRASL